MISPFSSLAEQGKALRKKQISSVELTQMYLARLKTIAKAHNAVAELTEDLAMRQAKAADASEPTSPLHGIPYGAKDLLATKGIPTRWGSPGHADQVFDYDATIIRKLADAGAVLAAKLEMIELAGGGNYNQANASRMGACLSAFDKTLWAGGSSSGSGAATALGCVGFSLGSETSGSIICPAAFNGATGFRPTYGRVSRYGAMALCWTLDKLGPIARSAEDCALVMQAIAGHDPLDPSSVKTPLRLNSRGPKPRIGLIKETFKENKALECEKGYQNVISELKKQGYEFVEITVPKLPYSLAISIIVSAEGASAHENFIRGPRLTELQDPNQVAGFTADLNTKAVDYLWAMRMRVEALRANEIWDKCDCLFTPVFYHRSILATKPFNETWRDMGDFDDPSNLLGWPSMAFPIAFEEGAPIGGQIIAPAWREDTCFRVVRDFQRTTDLHLKRPVTV